MLKGYDFDGVITAGVVPKPDSVIITGRSYEEAPESYQYLHKHGLFNAVYFNPVKYQERSLNLSAEWKAGMIAILGVTDFFEDDPRQIAVMKLLVRNCKIHLVLEEVKCS